jgi:glutamyl endopeptidase
MSVRPLRSRAPRQARHALLSLLPLISLAAVLGVAGPATNPAAGAAPPPDALVSDTGAVMAAGTPSAPGLALTGSRGNPESAGDESILNQDTRTRIADTSVYPARAIGLITRNGSQWCTGWLISKDTVATAGHCVHPGGGGSFYSGLQFWAGRDGSDPKWGSCTPRAGGLFAPSGWTTNGDEEYDLATIKLSCSVGNGTGWFGLWVQDSYTGTGVHVQGYPGDKPQTQWQGVGVVRATGDRQVFYDADTIGGMSGSPVYRTGSFPGCGQTACAAAIHTEGVHGSGLHALYNHGTRITATRATQLRSIATAA